MKSCVYLNLKARLYLLALVPLVPALLLILYAAVEQRNSAVQTIRHNAYHLAELAAAREGQILQGVHGQLRAMASVYQLDKNELDSARLGDFYLAMMHNLPGYKNIGVVRSDGKLMVSAVRLPENIDFSDRHWFKRALAFKGMAMGNFHLEQYGGSAVVVVAEPVIEPSRRTSAVVYAELDAVWLNRSLFGTALELPEGYNLIQIDPNGSQLIFNAQEMSWSTASKLDADTIKFILKTKRGVIEGTDTSGMAHIWAFADLSGPIQDRRLFFVLSIPKQTAFADVNRTLIRNLLWLALVTILIVLMVHFLGELFIVKRINTMLTAARRLTSGELDARVGPEGGSDELSRLARVFDEMADTIEQRIENEKEIREGLRQSGEQLRQLALHLQDIREEERARMAREIHDQFGQSLSVLKMDLAWLKKHLPAQPPELNGKLRAMGSVIDSTLRMVHEVCAELRPVILDDFGLAAAIEWQAEEFRNHTGIECEINVDTDEIDLNKDQSTAMFRIFQETLTNILRHAQARRVAVRLAKEDGRVVLTVADDGRGIMADEINSSKSFGLIGMRERLYPWGGEIRFSGSPGKGTRVVVSIPQK